MPRKKFVVNQLCRQRSDKLHKIKTNEILSAGTCYLLLKIPSSLFKVRLSFTTIFFSLAVFCAEAQNTKPDSVTQKAKAPDKIDSVQTKVDSVKKKSVLISSINPARQVGETTNALNAKVKSMTRVDSLFLFNTDMKKVDSLKREFQAKSNQIKTKASKSQRQIKHSMDSLQRKYQDQLKSTTSSRTLA